MNRKMYWGIAALIVILIAAGGFIYWQWSQVEQLKEELAQDAKMLEGNEEPVAENDLPPAKEGFKWVPHGDHFHEVPVSAPDTWQDAPPEPNAQPVVTYTGPLTYHEELLKTNPVKALKLQSEERGHINAKWIPPFPPDDVEAQSYARSIYQFIYNFDNNNPIYIDGVENSMLMSQRFHEKYGRTSARDNDLHKLSWVTLDFPMNHYYPDDIGVLSGYAMFPSDYFPAHISNLK